MGVSLLYLRDLVDWLGGVWSPYSFHALVCIQVASKI